MPKSTREPCLEYFRSYKSFTLGSFNSIAYSTCESTKTMEGYMTCFTSKNKDSKLENSSNADANDPSVLPNIATVLLMVKHVGNIANALTAETK